MRIVSVPERISVSGKASDVPLIAHVIYRLDVGGLENGLINLINRLPEDRFRHAIICLTGYSEFRRRIQRGDVPVFSLDKRAGHSPGMHFKLWRLIRRLRPDIIHTRNIAALEVALTATLAGVPVRIHGEHGRDVTDLDGRDVKYQVWRKLFKPFVNHYTAVSRDLERYLREEIRVPAGKITQVYNGVDTDLFHPAKSGREPLPQPDFASSNAFVIGAVGRMQAVKDPLNLAHAFIRLLRMLPAGRPVRLVMVGDGPLRAQVAEVLDASGAGEFAWLPGERDDVARIMRGLDLFVLPSLGEGISNTVLEAMASGLPVIATAVGGNSELVDGARTGCLVPRADPAAMANAMLRYYNDPEECRRQGKEARAIVESRFSMSAMVGSYLALYERLRTDRRLERNAPTCAES